MQNYKYDKTIVINLIAGPCAGKSTITSGIFYKLKMLGIDCEMALEYAKDRVWEEAYQTMKDQIYLFGKQYHKIWRLNHKVQVIITDCPLLLSVYYSKQCKTNSIYFNDLIIEQFNSFNNYNYFIERNTEYNQNGRVHTEEQSNQIDKELKDIMNTYNINYKTLYTTEAADIITNEIKELFNK